MYSASRLRCRHAPQWPGAWPIMWTLLRTDSTVTRMTDSEGAVERLRLRQVFTPGGLPSVTYVSRDQLRLEERISDAVERGFAFIVVTGPTKSGKSVLCKRVLKDRNMVTIEGGRVRNEDDFWNQLAHQMEISSATTKARASTETVTLTGGGTGGIPGIAQATGSMANAEAKQNTITSTFSRVVLLDAINKLVRDDVTLIVDDFHYISPDVQLSIVRALKGAVFDGLSVFFLAVPHRAFDPLSVENEVEGRFKHITIPEWSLDDLAKIPEIGFPALNVKVSRAIQRKICADSFGNPLLVQEICSEFCLKNSVRSYQSRSKKLKDSLLSLAYTEMAESKASPTFQKLRRGPDGRRSRKLRSLRGGGDSDIFNAILLALARLGPLPSTTYNEIRLSLQAVFEDGVAQPAKAELTAALATMNSLARERSQGEPPIEWVASEGALVITDPFLLFHMRWTYRDQGAIGLPRR